MTPGTLLLNGRSAPVEPGPSVMLEGQACRGLEGRHRHAGARIADATETDDRVSAHRKTQRNLPAARGYVDRRGRRETPESHRYLLMSTYANEPGTRITRLGARAVTVWSPASRYTNGITWPGRSGAPRPDSPLVSRARVSARQGSWESR